MSAKVLPVPDMSPTLRFSRRGVEIKERAGEIIEIIDSKELARRLAVPESWIRSRTQQRTAASSRIPHLALGRYRRFLWGSVELDNWIAQQVVR